MLFQVRQREPDSMPSSMLRPVSGSLVSWRTLHLITLSAFAITQPILTALIGRPVFLHDQEYGYAEIGGLIFVLMVLVPGVWIVIDLMIQLVTARLKCPGRNLVIGALLTLLIMSVLRPYLCVPSLMDTGYVVYLDVIVSTVTASLIATLYGRASWLRSWLTWASLGLIVFPSAFLWQFYSILKTERQLQVQVQAKAPVPVVMLVFDELSGITLFNKDGQIDAIRYPQFARLANQSTWYRNATTVSPRTDVAVPAILSGRYPVSNRDPLASEYPGNLFQVIETSQQFDMAVFEPVTRLCPDSVRFLPKPSKSIEQKWGELVYTVATVYPRLIFTSDIPYSLPAIPYAWFGVSSDYKQRLEEFLKHSKGRYRFPGTEYRPFQQSHFLRCLELLDRPRFCFMHTVLPHFPWSFLPSGEQYQSENAASGVPSAGRGELGEDWDNDVVNVARNEYRYRLQLGYVDRFIGQVLDRLEETGQRDCCLLIVTADHGVSFRPGNSRRLPDKDNLAEILSVPLFIKFPGQTEPHVDDRNVENIDLYPTIADVLQIELPAPVDGTSVRESLRQPRKSLYDQGNLIAVEPDFPQRWPAIQHQAMRYPTGSIRQISDQAFCHPEWHGRPLGTFAIADRTIPAVQFKNTSPMNEALFSMPLPLVPCFFWGFLKADDLTELPAEILLVIDGVVVDSTRTCQFDRNLHEFQFLYPDDVSQNKDAKVELYLVTPRDSAGLLTRLVVEESIQAQK